MTEFIVALFALIGAFCIGAAFATRLCRKDIENVRKEMNKHITLEIRHED